MLEKELQKNNYKNNKEYNEILNENNTYKNTITQLQSSIDKLKTENDNLNSIVTRNQTRLSNYLLTNSKFKNTIIN